MEEPTRIVLLRHGQTALSVDRRYSGRGNPELTALGRAQASAAGERIGGGGLGRIDAVLSSPLVRAMDTATAAAERLGAEVEVCDGLIETDFGAWEGLTFGEAARRDPEVHGRWLADADVAPPGGESFAQVQERIAATREDIVARFPGRTVLAVSHVTPIKSMLRQALTVGPELLFRLHLDLASISVVEFFPDGGSVVRLVNDTAHLQ
ncbi:MULTISPECIES: histidine phosphatase family protein [Gordonia]|nr:MULTISPECIES: histidine phosphatase family protein [Gordonia]AUH70258.1 histidine phosphatase family protein [Gordonia sp. YC-JH1]MBY4571280.1 histidine phosphatase family protein [Gordonia sihwensis]WFN95001.1 histidine phosphatase family protein [Gordonia sihwensis]